MGEKRSVRAEGHVGHAHQGFACWAQELYFFYGRMTENKEWGETGASITQRCAFSGGHSGAGTLLEEGRREGRVGRTRGGPCAGSAARCLGPILVPRQRQEGDNLYSAIRQGSLGQFSPAVSLSALSGRCPSGFARRQADNLGLQPGSCCHHNWRGECHLGLSATPCASCLVGKQPQRVGGWGGERAGPCRGVGTAGKTGIPRAFIAMETFLW